MRTFKRQIYFFTLLSIIFCQQDVYRTVDDIKDEWTGYTSYQKEEMLSFCDFLFREGHYERCLLNSFQILYKFPEDKTTIVTEYYIARCYEEMKNYKLAQKYYSKVIEATDSDLTIHRAANYRMIYVDLTMGNLDVVLENTQPGKDPYMEVFRGYAYLKNAEWEEARISFISAQRIFNHPHYDNLITPIYQAIENVNEIPRHNRYFVFLAGTIFPGGGQFLLGERNNGQGILSTFGLMMLIRSWSKGENIFGGNRLLDIESTSIPLNKNYNYGNSVGSGNSQKLPKKLVISSSSIKFSLPPLIIGAGIFIGSSWKSFVNTQEKNKTLVEFYVEEKTKKITPGQFLDFPEPELVINRK